ncbi:hypothetical protein A2U01_0072204, partial [Trifolium medium]|nr:hypothetical protein [Trifolium medium]
APSSAMDVVVVVVVVSYAYAMFIVDLLCMP